MIENQHKSTVIGWLLATVVTVLGAVIVVAFLFGQMVKEITIISKNHMYTREQIVDMMGRVSNIESAIVLNTAQVDLLNDYLPPCIDLTREHGGIGVLRNRLEQEH